MQIDYVVLPICLLIFAVLLLVTAIGYSRYKADRRSSTWWRLSQGSLWALAGISSLVACSSAINALAIHRFWSAHPPQGRIVSVDSSLMHVQCMGVGSPTLILESGLGDSSLIWAGVQPKLAAVTRVCAYDRAGLGWSAARAERRDADHIAQELHELLMQGGVVGPLVFVGHSAGGLYIRDFTARYPFQVAGLVFVDSSTPLQDRNPALAETSKPAWLLRAAMVAGVPRLLGMCSGGKQDEGYSKRKLQAEDVCRTSYSSIQAELNSFDRSGEETVHTGPYGHLPELVLSRDPRSMLEDKGSAKTLIAQQAWTVYQQKLCDLSTQCHQVVALGSGHYVALDRPDLLVSEIAKFLNVIRSASAAEPQHNESSH